MYFKVLDVSTQADYFAFRKIGGTILDNKKPLQKTLPISSIMPSGATFIAFNNSLSAATGWQGASTAGISDINTNGLWDLKVYEVDGLTGLRKTKVVGSTTYIAPDVVNTAGLSGASGGFSYSAYCKTFNSFSPNNFYVDASSNFGDGDVFFKSYYDWAKLQSAAALTTFSNITWCADFTVNVNGCIASNKSFFRIASAFNLVNGSNAKNTNPESTNLMFEFKVYPNPTNDFINISFPSTINNSIIIYNLKGETIKIIEDINSNYLKVDITNLLSGVYIYKAISGGEEFNGEIIKK
jgi:Secretion system C-terminal sorting domain